jgi:Cdc6-like AAA superfamily ATPase
LAKTNLVHPDAGQFLNGLAVIRERLQMINAREENAALAMTLTGKPGAGKTELASRVTDYVEELLPSRDRPMPIVKVTLTGGTTVKSLWIDVCNAADVILKPRETENSILPKLFRRLQALGTQMIIFDEAHHALSQGQGDIQVANRLKSRLLDNPTQPIFLILVGLPEIEQFISIDSQLGRRTIQTRLRDLTRGEAHQICRALLEKGRQRAGLTVSADITENSTCERLADASDLMFGIMIDLLDRALRRAVGSQRGFVNSEDLIWSGRLHLGTLENDVFDNRAWRPNASRAS